MVIKFSSHFFLLKLLWVFRLKIILKKFWFE